MLGTRTKPPDVIVVGTQECKYKHGKDVLTTKDLHQLIDHEHHDHNQEGGTDVEEDEGIDAGHSHWVNMLTAVVGNDYHIVSKEHLLEMRLVVFSTRSVLSKVTGMSHKHKATGIAHLYGNKGGLVSSIRFGGTILTFVSCHLAAHSHHLMRRHHDVQVKINFFFFIFLF